MVNIQMDGKVANITFCGEPKDVAMEVGAAVSGIYQGIYDMDQEDAELFKAMMQIAMKDKSPVWERSHEMTMIVLPGTK